MLDDGGIVRIVGRPEPLIEIAAADSHELARLAWHIGNRHIDVQIVGDRLRIRRDHVIEDMLRGLGARLAPVSRHSIRSRAPTASTRTAVGMGTIMRMVIVTSVTTIMARALVRVPAKAGTQAGEAAGFPPSQE